MVTPKLLLVALSLVAVSLHATSGQNLESESGICHLTCKVENDLVSDPFDCSSYYRCGLGKLDHYKCPRRKPYFSILGCSADPSFCCQPSCNPNCTEVDTIIPDPKNCSNYYVCAETGTPNEKAKRACPRGSHFDTALGECSSVAKCQTLCPESATEIVPSTGMTSSTVTKVTSTVETTTGADCQESFACPAVGLFPKCQSCQPEYYKCSAVGQQGQEQKCPGNLVFSTDPALPYCILLSDCNANA